MKKTMAAIMAVMAFCAIGAQAASANWFDSGEGLGSGQNPTFEATGTVSLSSSAGGVHCNTGTWRFQLTGNSTWGHVLASGVEQVSKCEISGGLVFLTGGTTSLKSVNLTGTPTMANAVVIGIVGTTMHYQFNNGFNFTLSTIPGEFGGEQAILATPNNTTSISSLALSGELNSTLGGRVKISGNLNVLSPNFGTYGLVS